MRLERFAPSRAGVRALAKSHGAEMACLDAAKGISARASAMYGATHYPVHSKSDGSRARAYVAAGDLHAMRSNAKHNTLLKAMKGR